MRIGVLTGMLGIAAAPASLYAETGDRAGGTLPDSGR